MSNEITLLKNNDNREWDDIEWVNEFYRFLQEGIKLSQSKAFSIIHYLQEHFPVLPDNIEKCSVCGDLYDSGRSGYHSELNGKFYCNSDYPYQLADKEERMEEKEHQKYLKSITNGK